MDKNEIILFETADHAVKLNVSTDGDTVWLSRTQIAELFDRDISVIGRHINAVFKENELDRESNVQNLHITNKFKPVDFYSLDVIISVGYRVKSQRGVEFRKWANKVLKDYIIKGYAINNKRIEQIGEVIRIMKRAENQLDAKQVLSVIEKFNAALDLLDDYDHQTMKRPEGNKAAYVLRYEECRKVINEMKFASDSELFGNEKDDSFKGSIANIYQEFGGVEIYPSLEEKAANLLYFVTKNHSFTEFSFDEECRTSSEGESETEYKNDAYINGPLEKHINKLRARYFKKLKKKTDKLIAELRTGKEQIHAFVPSKDNRYIVIEFFKSEKEFKCVWKTSDYGKNYKDELLEKINSAPDVDPDFDFEAAYEYINSSAKDNKSVISEYAAFKDYYSLLYAFYKLKMKQGKSIKEINAFEASVCEDKKKIVEIGDTDPTFTLSDGREVKLSVQDLVDGYTLGIYTIEELGNFKLKHNSLKIEDLL